METRIRVFEAAETLGYQPSYTARSLRRQRTDKIGLAFFSAYEYRYTSEFYFEMMRGAAYAAEKTRYNLVLYTSIAPKTERLLRICQAQEVDGMILMGGELPLAAATELLLKQKMPFVVLHAKADRPEVSYVAPDNEHGGYLATRHLLELGHRRVAYVGRGHSDLECMARLAGFRRAHADFRIPVSEELVVHCAMEETEILGAVHKLLGADDPPTAIFAFNDFRAIRAMRAIHSRGLRVPDDIAVVGFDDVHSASAAAPQLTTIHQPLVEMGMTAAEVLLRQLFNGGGPPVHENVPVQLVIRGSTAVRRGI